jgi:calcium-dependent protein kinase
MLTMKYDILKQLGKGGNAHVSLIRQKQYPHNQYACKIIPKALDPSRYSEKKRLYHVANIKKEIEVMKRLQFDDRVIHLEDVFEDDDNFYIVMEKCDGGDIYKYLESNQKKLSEESVRNIIKQCMDIIAVCHNNDIIHNDVKPENFLFVEENNLQSIKLIDFGISIISTDNNDLSGLEMTPWYGSPETLSSKTCKKSDVWAIGVMTHLLLCGKFPFNDKQNPYQPSVYKIWNSILNDKLDFSKSYWNNISKEAKDFIEKLLTKDVDMRPTIYEALAHPWITKKDTDINKEIGRKVVQNIVKYNKKNVMMRTIFENMVDVILTRYEKDHQRYAKLEKVPSEQSLYNANNAILSLNNTRLSYILHVLRERTITRNDKISKNDFKNVLKRLNSEHNIDLLLERLEEKGDEIDIKKIISSQMDWNELLESSKHFEQFLTEVFEEFDQDKTGIIKKKDVSNSACQVIFENKSYLSFEEFMENVTNVIDRYDTNTNGNDEDDDKRVHGNKKAAIQFNFM